MIKPDAPTQLLPTLSALEKRPNLNSHKHLLQGKEDTQIQIIRGNAWKLPNQVDFWATYIAQYFHHTSAKKNMHLHVPWMWRHTNQQTKQWQQSPMQWYQFTSTRLLTWDFQQTWHLLPMLLLASCTVYMVAVSGLSMVGAQGTHRSHCRAKWQFSTNQVTVKHQTPSIRRFCLAVALVDCVLDIVFRETFVCIGWETKKRALVTSKNNCISWCISTEAKQNNLHQRANSQHNNVRQQWNEPIMAWPISNFIVDDMWFQCLKQKEISVTNGIQIWPHTSVLLTILHNTFAPNSANTW